MPKVVWLETRVWFRQSAFGLMAGVAFVCARLALRPVLGDALPLVLAYPATVVIIMLRGSVAGLACAVTCVVGAAVSFPAQLGSVSEALQAGALLLCAAGLCVATHRWSIFPSNPNSAPDGGESATTGWLRAIFLAALIVPAASFIGVAGVTYWQAERDARSYAERTAAIVQRHADESFRSAALVARAMSRLSTTLDSRGPLAGTELATRMRLLTVGVPGVLGARVEDAEGALVAQVESVATVPVPVRQADRLKQPSVSSISATSFDGERAIALRFPRVLVSGKEVGSVDIFLSAAHFEEYYRSLNSGRLRQASFELLDRDGSSLACWPRPRLEEMSRLRPANRSPAASATLLDWSYWKSDGPRGTVSVESRRQVEGMPVVATVAISRPQVLAGWVSLVGAVAAIMAPITAWLVCVSWLALNRTRRARGFALSLEQEGSKLRVAEENALRNQKWETLATLTGGIAHDFNNLLSILLTNLHVHERRHPAQMTEPQMQSMLRTARSGVRLTQQLLSVSRTQKRGTDTVSLQAWLPATAELLRSTLGANIKLEYSVSAEAGAIAVDVSELELALINLSLNAKHAMPNGGTLTIIGRNARPEEGFDRPTVAVCAKDTGHGIPADIIPRIFEPFFSTKARGVGTGLGLSQIAAFVGNAGGEVQVESAEDVGTTVHMYFPQAVPAPQSSASVFQADADLRGMRLLLVDSNAEVATAVRAMLLSSGMDAVHVDDAYKAVELVEAEWGSFDAVLTHAKPLGGQDGLQLARTLSVLAPRLPVILMTGYADQAALARAEGFEAVLKPIVPDEFLAVLRQMTSARRASRPSA